MKTISIFFALSVLFLLSCSEENSVNNTKFDILPMTVGNFWVYNTAFLDSNGTQLPFTDTKDSVVVSGTELIGGKDSYEMTTYSNNFGDYREVGKMYYYTEGEKLFLWSDYLKSFFKGFPINLDNLIKSEWLQIVNREDDYWKISEYELNDIEIIPSLLFSGDVTMTGERKDDETITSPVGDKLCEKYVMNLKIDGLIKTEQGDLPIDVQSDVTFYFAPNIGVVKREINNIDIVVPIFGEMQLEGSVQLINNYKLN